MKYAFILKNRSQWPVSILCEVLDVSPSGYHSAEQRKPVRADTYQGTKRISNDLLLANIRTVHAASKGEYGWPRVWKVLLQKGIPVGKERVRKLMNQYNICARHKRKFESPPTPGITCRLHRTCWSATSPPQNRIGFGLLI